MKIAPIIKVTQSKNRRKPLDNAKWVCNKINSKFPRISPSFLQPLIVRQKGTPNAFFPPVLVDVLYSKLLNLRDIAKHNKTNFLKHSIEAITEHKTGNCTELAYLTKLILEKNGIKNVSIVKMTDKKNNRDIDHCVCIFNRDGSVVESEKTRNAIVVDPMLGKSDYADNIGIYYRNIFSDFLRLKSGARFEYRPINEQAEFSGEHVNAFLQKHPDVIRKAPK